MSRLTFDIDALAEQTLELSKNLRKDSVIDDDFCLDSQGEFDFSSTYSEENLNEQESSRAQKYNEDIEIEIKDNDNDDLEYSTQHDHNVAGIVFRLDKGISTFCLRGFATDNLAWEKAAFHERDPKLLEILRLENDEQVLGETKIHYFAIGDFDLAQICISQLFNRRFPRQEAFLCNLSDPGFSWWLKDTDNGFELYFQSQTIDRDSDLIQLGPLGEATQFKQNLASSHDFFQRHFEANEFSLTDKAFCLSTEASDDSSFSVIKNLFIDGALEDFSEWILRYDEPFDKQGMYLLELGVIRKFWLSIEKLLE